MNRRVQWVAVCLAAVVVMVAALAMAFIPGRSHDKPDPKSRKPSALEKELENPANKLAATIKKLGQGRYQLGAVTIDARARELSFPGKVNMVDGLIEVLICTPYGKVHESVFVVDVRPMDLHTSCLLMGLRDGSNPAWRIPADASFRWPGWDRPAGSMAEIWVGWDAPDGKHEIRAEEVLMDQRTKEPIGACNWVFIGSIVDPEGNYTADGVGSIASNYHDPQSVFDCPLESGRVDDFTFVNQKVLPPVGSQIRIRVVPIENSTQEKLS
jgi:hypothetical protein